MPTLREVKKRIRSVQSTKRITKAMEMVSAAKLRRAQNRVEQAKPYARKLDEMLQHLAAASSGEIRHPYFEDRDHKKRKTLVVIASDRGLCGSFNSNVLRRADKWLNENSDYELEIVAIGKRVRDYYKRRDREIFQSHIDWNGRLDYDRARDIVETLTSRFVSGRTDEIALVFTQFLSMASYQVTTQPYLPIPRPDTESDEEGHGISDYIFEPSADEIYAALLPSYATTKMVTALTESFASEHGSRMMAMSNATNNAGEMVDQLTLDYNKARQGQITKELLEIVGGAEALKQ